MGKGGGATQKIDEYRMAIHWGICAELDAVTGIYVGEKTAWEGEATSEQGILVYAPDLFGGQKKEGGVSGIAYFLPGGPDQVLPNGLAQRRGLSSSTHPAYRGIASLYMVGTMQPGEGFYWGNTPYMQGTWVRGRRAPKGLDPTYALIGNRISATFSGDTVTTGGATATLLPGITAVVGGHSVARTAYTSEDRTQYLIDGVTVDVYNNAHVEGGGVVNDSTGSPIGSIISAIVGDSTSKQVIGISGQYVAGYSARFNGVTVSASRSGATIAFGADGQDANPAHIVYECLTNTTWGMGATDAIIDRANFEAVAIVLFNEAFGLSLMWTRESSIESFIREILDHVQATLYVDPDTGKITMKLYRDDYDSETLPLLTPDNADLNNYQRKLWGETVNEVSVTWTNPVNEQEETVTQQDLGNITVQGAVVSTSRNYYGVRTSTLASTLALRDSRQSAAPLASLEAKVDRTQWNLKPGSVVRVSWPEYDILNLVMRVTNVDYGKIGTPFITLTLLEDIFSLEDAAYNQAPGTGWINPATNPTPMDHTRVITAPAYFSTRRLSAADSAALTYPDVLVAVLAASSNPDVSSYELIGQSVLPNGTTVAEAIGTRAPLGYAQMPTALPAEASTLVADFGPVVGSSVPTVAGFVFIGDANEQTMEIALLESVSESGWVLARGVLDTQPRAWPVGTGVWFYDIRTDFFDPDLRSEGEGANYKLLSATSRGRLAIESAPLVGALLTARPHLPNRPANVVIAGQAFGAIDLTGTSPTSISVTWANRNRTMEDGTIVKWSDATVIPETGQTTTITVVATDGTTVLATHAGLTGTSFSIPVSEFGSNYEADIRVKAVRDGLSSLQTVARRVRISTPTGAGGVGDPGTGGGGGDYNPGPSFPPPWNPPGDRCLVVSARFLLSNHMHDGPGGTCRGDELVAGKTWLWTQDQHSKEWGSHLVIAVTFADEPVFSAAGFDDATAGHPFWVDGKWVRMCDIGTPAGVARVVKVTVDGAHTYVTVRPYGRQVLSHNLKIRTLPTD